MGEIEVFDSLKEHPDGFDAVDITMTTVLGRNKPVIGARFKPNILVKAETITHDMTTTYNYGLEYIDACLIDIDTMDCISLYGPSADIEFRNVARIVGLSTEYNSDTRDMNTGRLRITHRKDHS
jgi:hypothetical protein